MLHGTNGLVAVLCCDDYAVFAFLYLFIIHYIHIYGCVCVCLYVKIVFRPILTRISCCCCCYSALAYDAAECNENN